MQNMNHLVLIFRLSVSDVSDRHQKRITIIIKRAKTIYVRPNYFGNCLADFNKTVFGKAQRHLRPPPNFFIYWFNMEWFKREKLVKSWFKTTQYKIHTKRYHFTFKCFDFNQTYVSKLSVHSVSHATFDKFLIASFTMFCISSWTSLCSLSVFTTYYRRKKIVFNSDINLCFM